MSIVLAFFQLVLISYITLDEVKRKSSAAFMWATLLLMFGVMHFYSSLIGHSQYDNGILSKASLFVSLFCLIYIFVRKGTKKHSFRISEEFDYSNLASQETENTTFPFVVFVLVSLFFVWRMTRYSGGILNTSWSSGRDFAATQGYVNSNQMINLLYFAVSGLPIYLFIHKEYRKMILCVFATLILVIVTRNRITITPLFVLTVSIVLFKMHSVKIKYIIGAIIGAALVVYIVYGLLVFRHYGSIGAFISNFDFNEFNRRISNYISVGYGELGLRNDFYHFIENNNNFDGFGRGATYIRMLLVYIPQRFSLGLKPEDFAVAMGAATGATAGVSTHPTLFGDCYANLGWFGVFLGAFWALYAGLADKVTLRFRSQLYRLMVYGLNASMFIIMGRGSVYNSFFFIAWDIPLLIILSFLHNQMPKIIIRLK